MEKMHYKQVAEDFKRNHDYLFFVNETNKTKESEISLLFEQVESTKGDGIYQEGVYNVFLQNKKVSLGMRLGHLFKGADKYFDSGLPTRITIITGGKRLQVRDIFRSTDTISRIFEQGVFHYEEKSREYNIKEERSEKKGSQNTTDNFAVLKESLIEPKIIQHANNTYLVGKNKKDELEAYRKDGTQLKKGTYTSLILEKYLDFLSKK